MPEPRPIYLDYNATTPVDPAVREAMLPFLDAEFGNPSSSHAYGQVAHAAIDRARREVASLVGCEPDEIVFTGAGSEADNLAIKGIALRAGRGHIVTSSIEHPAVANACRWLAQRFGFDVTWLPVDRLGQVDPNDLRRAIRADTVLVSIMCANNETGVIQPIAKIAAVCRARGVPCHTDAAQTVGKVPTRVGDMGVDLLALAGHKLYAPKGVGALYLRRGIELDPLIHGGGQERGRRAGTEAIAQLVALGTASSIAEARLPDDEPRLRSLRDRLLAALVEDAWLLNGHPTERLPNTLNVSAPGVDGEALLAACPEIAASTGSACHAGRTEPSDVLVAMGLDRDRALGALRLSLGRWSSEGEVDEAARLLIAARRRLAG